jgi:hypothetical protein
LGGINRRIEVQASLGIKQDPISKITNTKTAWGMAQLEAFSLSKLEALSSNPQYCQKKSPSKPKQNETKL